MVRHHKKTKKHSRRRRTRRGGNPGEIPIAKLVADNDRESHFMSAGEYQKMLSPFSRMFEDMDVKGGVIKYIGLDNEQNIQIDAINLFRTIDRETFRTAEEVNATEHVGTVIIPKDSSMKYFVAREPIAKNFFRGWEHYKVGLEKHSPFRVK